MEQKINKRDKLRKEHKEKHKREKFENSPFTDGYKPETRIAYTYTKLKGHSLVNNDTGDVMPAEYRVPYEVDAGRFVKLPHNILPELKYLSNTARRCLDFIMYQLLPDNAVVWAPAAEAVTFCGFTTPKSWYDGVNELVAMEYVARTVRQSFYHANPRRFHNGSRMKLKHDFIKPTHKS